MPRSPRVFVNGAVYHIYCRTAHGEPVFAERDEARRLLEVVREVRDRDGFSILAWCIMPSHYHLALRTGRVPLWRSMRLIQGRSSVDYCRRRRVPGPLWQERYQARLIHDQGTCALAVAYIHLNPVAVGLVRDPAAYRWSGHGELVGRRRQELADVTGTLALFGDTPDGAHIAYVATLRGPHGESLAKLLPGRLPWWRGREAGAGVLEAGRGAVPDPLGASTAPSPDRTGVDELIRHALAELKLSVGALTGRRKPVRLSLSREALILVGVEQFRVRVNDLARSLGMNAGSVSRALGRATARRQEDVAFADLCRRLETGIGAARSAWRSQDDRELESKR